MPGKVIVFTITGDQGMSVAHYLSQAGWEVAGFSRNPNSARAKGLPVSLLLFPLS